MVHPSHVAVPRLYRKCVRITLPVHSIGSSGIIYPAHERIDSWIGVGGLVVEMWFDRANWGKRKDLAETSFRRVFSVLSLPEYRSCLSVGR